MWLLLALVSTCLWGISNVTDSLLVRSYEKNPMVVLWFSSVYKLLLLAVLLLFVDVQTDWAFLLFLFGGFYYAGALVYIRVLHDIDVSVINAAWAIQSVFLSLGGFLLFQESWSPPQTIGVAIVLAGVFYLSYAHKHVSVLYSLFLLSATAIVFIPEELLQKAALMADQNTLVVFFWSMLGNATFSFVSPLLLPQMRSGIVARWRTVNGRFFGIYLCGVLTMFFGMYIGILAYAVGQISLVAVASNIQPFVVILFAWILSRLAPDLAPRELLTAQSVQVKIVSFLVVFCGLALLAL